jgi:hypothetical protein
MQSHHAPTESYIRKPCPEVLRDFYNLYLVHYKSQKKEKNKTEPATTPNNISSTPPSPSLFFVPTTFSELTSSMTSVYKQMAEIGGVVASKAANVASTGANFVKGAIDQWGGKAEKLQAFMREIDSKLLKCDSYSPEEWILFMIRLREIGYEAQELKTKIGQSHLCEILFAMADYIQYATIQYKPIEERKEERAKRFVVSNSNSPNTENEYETAYISAYDNICAEIKKKKLELQADRRTGGNEREKLTDDLKKLVVKLAFTGDIDAIDEANMFKNAFDCLPDVPAKNGVLLNRTENKALSVCTDTFHKTRPYVLQEQFCFILYTDIYQAKENKDMVKFEKESIKKYVENLKTKSQSLHSIDSTIKDPTNVENWQLFSSKTKSDIKSTLPFTSIKNTDPIKPSTDIEEFHEIPPETRLASKDQKNHVQSLNTHSTTFHPTKGKKVAKEPSQSLEGNRMTN